MPKRRKYVAPKSRENKKLSKPWELAPKAATEPAVSDPNVENKTAEEEAVEAEIEAILQEIEAQEQGTVPSGDGGMTDPGFPNENDLVAAAQMAQIANPNSAFNKAIGILTQGFQKAGKEGLFSKPSKVGLDDVAKAQERAEPMNLVAEPVTQPLAPLQSIINEPFRAEQVEAPMVTAAGLIGMRNASLQNELSRKQEQAEDLRSFLA